MTILTSASALAQAELALDADDRGELLSAIRTEAQRLDRIVGNLLDLSRLQAGAARPEPAVCALDDLVCRRWLTSATPSRIDVPARPNMAVRADPHQVERALANLIETPSSTRPRTSASACRSAAPQQRCTSA